MVKVVVDSSVIIEYLRSSKGLLLKLFKMAEANKISLILSSVVVFEIWSGRSMEIGEMENKVVGLLEGFDRVEFDEKMGKLAGSLRRKGQVDGFDAVIAATCLQEDAQLATLNKKHFEKVKGLELWSR